MSSRYDLGIIDDGDVRQAVHPGKLRNNPAVPPWHGFDRDIERGEEIQEGKARCPGAKEEGDENEGEAGKKGKVKKTRSETCPSSDDGAATACSGTAIPRGND
jgi:hypothetical protein